METQKQTLNRGPTIITILAELRIRPWDHAAYMHCIFISD
jgi:hypothetical protein